MAGLAHFALHGCQIVFRNPTGSGAATLIRRVGIPKRQAGKQNEPKDELDNLMDELDKLDL